MSKFVWIRSFGASLVSAAILLLPTIAMAIYTMGQLSGSSGELSDEEMAQVQDNDSGIRACVVMLMAVPWIYMVLVVAFYVAGNALVLARIRRRIPFLLSMNTLFIIVPVALLFKYVPVEFDFSAIGHVSMLLVAPALISTYFWWRTVVGTNEVLQPSTQHSPASL